MTLGAGPLSALLALPATPLLTGAGLSMLPWCAVLLWLARRDTLDRRAVWAVIAVNAVWVVDSVLLLAGGWVQPTLLGQAFVIAQALAVVLFAELQFLGSSARPKRSVDNPFSRMNSLPPKAGIVWGGRRSLRPPAESRMASLGGPGKRVPLRTANLRFAPMKSPSQEGLRCSAAISRGRRAARPWA